MVATLDYLLLIINSSVNADLTDYNLLSETCYCEHDSTVQIC